MSFPRLDAEIQVRVHVVVPGDVHVHPGHAHHSFHGRPGVRLGGHRLGQRDQLAGGGFELALEFSAEIGGVLGVGRGWGEGGEGKDGQGGEEGEAGGADLAAIRGVLHEFGRSMAGDWVRVTASM